MARILVVEDDLDLSAFLSDALKTWGHDVDVAYDGVQAYERVYVSRRPYDAVLCDLELPRMPGPTFLETATAQLRGKTPVIIVTGAERMVEALGETRRWAFGLLRKPFEMEHLKEIVDHALRQRTIYTTADTQGRRIEELEARVRDLVRQNQALFDEARLDALTRLPNRRRLEEDLGRSYANADRYDRAFAMALLDVDRFRRYNRQLGYAGGDRAIRRVADLLREAVRKGDTVYRFGGDEFVLLMQDQDLAQGLHATQRVLDAVSGAEPLHEDGQPLTLSAGVTAVGRGDPRSITMLLRRADELLRKAKAKGGNRVMPRPNAAVPEPARETA